MYQNLLDSKAENERHRMEKRARDRMLMSVKPRKQPPRHVAADIVYPCNSDSDDLDSENSNDSYRLSDAMKDQTYNYLHTDSEFMSGLDEEEFIQKTKKKEIRFREKGKG